MIEPNENGYMHSYYGTHHLDDPKPKKGVIYFMLEEHINKTVENKTDIMVKDLEKMIDNFRQDYKDKITKTNNELYDIKMLVGSLRRFMVDVMQTNDLVMPKMENVKF